MDGERGSPTSDETAGSSNNSTNTKMSTQMRSIKKERGSSMGSYRVSVSVHLYLALIVKKN